MPASEETVRDRLHYVRMVGPEVFKFAMRVLASSTRQVLQKAGLQVSDVDLFIPHQANKRIIDPGVKRLGIPEERVFVNIERYGNTSSASIPIALCEAHAEGRLRSGDTVAMVGFGAGLTWGAGVLQWTAHLAPEPQAELAAAVSGVGRG